MPPKTKITKEMIVDAAYKITQEIGAESINARTISTKLGCSTQPVMYQFKKIEDIKKAVYEKADKYHTAYITDIYSNNPMKEIGLLYIRFASREKNLFRFLFQTNEFSGKSISELINAEELKPILAILGQATEVSNEQAKNIFKLLFLFAHGYASMYANNSLDYNEEIISADLDRIFFGAIYTSKEEL